MNPARKKLFTLVKSKNGLSVKVRGSDLFHKVLDMVDLGDGAGNKYVLDGGLEVHQDDVVDFQLDGLKKVDKKSLSFFKVKESLEKGVAKRLFPFNPNEVDEEERENIADWTLDVDGSAKTQIPKLEGNARKRALLKLAANTKTRRNPETGEPEYFLHRGITADDLLDGMGNSFTPHYDVAESFAAETDEEMEGFDTGIVSGWFPESAIHHVPKIIGRAREPQKGSLESDEGFRERTSWAPRSSEHRSEFEVIIDPNFRPDLEHTPFGKKQSGGDLNERINQRQSDKEKAVLKKFGINKSLKKGLRGDWKKEGYRLEHHQDKDGYHNVSAYDNKNNLIGFAQFTYDYTPDEDGPGLVAGDLKGWDVKVHPNHQRKGLASAMYELVEEKSGKKIIPGGTTDEGSNFWNQPNRKFGKSLQKSIPQDHVVFYSDGDNVGSLVEKATLTDNLDKVVEIAMKINKMGDILERHVLALGGKVINRGGDDFLAIIPTDKTPYLELARQEITKDLGFTNTIGVGETPTKAARALIWGKLNGKNMISSWDENKDSELSELMRPQTQEDKAKDLLGQK